MSRIGRQPINIPQGVDVTITDQNVVITKGPKGELSLNVPKFVSVSKSDNVITVSVKNEKKHKSIWGTIQRLISNNIKGVAEGFSKQLKISGVGYRASLKGKTLVLEVGFSHPIEFQIPNDIEVKVDGNTTITVSGIDKQKVGQIAADIRKIKKPEPYKGKGIAYSDEVIRRKPGKQAAGAGGE